MVNELDPATKPAKKTCYCVECNAAITATQAKNTYSTYDTTLCGECVVDTCATRKEPVPAWATLAGFERVDRNEPDKSGSSTANISNTQCNCKV